MPSPIIVTAVQGDTVDLIVWRRYGRTAGITEAVYAANRGLAEIGPTLPAGHQVLLPPLDEVPGSTDPPLVRLWS
jgi:phage tail protein X